MCVCDRAGRRYGDGAAGINGVCGQCQLEEYGCEYSSVSYMTTVCMCVCVCVCTGFISGEQGGGAFAPPPPLNLVCSP